MSAPLDIDIAIEAGDWPENLAPLARRALTVALENSGYPIDGPCEISVLLTNDEHQRALNARWRGMDKSTNVLSFPAREPEERVEGLLGDISLALETLQREAETLEKPFEHHFAHLLVHGCLHILGFGHETQNQALVMETLETDIMALLGFPDPYEGQELDLG